MSLGLGSNQYERKRRALQLILGICVAAAILISGLLAIFLRPAHAAELSPDDFVVTFKTDVWSDTDTSVVISTNSEYVYNYDIDWDNDGTFDAFGVTDRAYHYYDQPGEYTVRIRGEFPAYQCAYGAGVGCYKITAINQWGSGVWKTMAMAFYGAQSLQSVPTDAPDLSEVTDMSGMFMYAGSFNSSLANWDTSHITNMSGMFRYAAAFNGNLSGWDTSRVTDMSSLFDSTDVFNSDISQWDTSQVANMSGMFNSAGVFSGDISQWDTSRVTDMSNMFQDAAAFNGDLSGWNTSRVTDMSGMFAYTGMFDGDLSGWDMSHVIAADSMFDYSNFTLESYATALNGWASQNLQAGVTLGVNGLKYCSLPSRQFIIDTFSWAFDGDAAIPACTVSFNGTDTHASLQEDLPVGTPIATLKADKFTLRSTQPYTLGCAVPGADDSFFTIGGLNGTQLLTNELFSYTKVDDAPQFARVTSSANQTNDYEVCVKAHTLDGEVVENYLTVQVTKGPRVQTITGANFSQHDNKTYLMIDGKWFMPGESRWEYEDGFERSLVRLNGVDLGACLEPTGMTMDQLVEEYSWLSPEDLARNVTSTPPCYLLMDSNWNGLITPTQAVIVLPAGYDTSARGTVSVNGSNTYTFNAVSGGTPVQPDANVNGTKPLPQHPTIPARPTFSGMAEPGAQVTVTVHSDPVTCSTTADVTGNWSCTLASDLPAGEHTVYVRVTNPDSSITELGPYAVTVDGSLAGVVTPTSPRAPGAPNTGLFETVRAKRAHDAGQATKQRTVLIGVVSTAVVVGLAVVLYGLHRYRRRQSVSFDNK